MIKVLMLCYGNICRSPMAEAVFQHMVKEAGLDAQIQVDSAGTSDYHQGEEAHPGTRAVLKKHQIPYNGRSRPLTGTDFTTFDYVLCMDEANLSVTRLYANHSEATCRLFLADAYQQGLVQLLEVPDPYYTGKYDETYALVTAGSQALLARIRQDHNL